MSKSVEFCELDRKVSSSSSTKSRCHRRSTLVEVPLSSHIEDETSEKDFIIHVPTRRSKAGHFTLSNIRSTSHDSIELIQENPSSCLPRRSGPFETYSHQGTTRIKLTLPLSPSNPVNQSRRRYPHSTGTTEVSRADEEKASGEFTLPTNPPITVTIEPQSSSTTGYESLGHEPSYPDDQICSPENVRLKENHSSVDPALKGGSSTVVSYFLDLLKPSDNKLAMKLFGSRKGVLKERLRQQRAGHCIIHPCSNFRFVLSFPPANSLFVVLRFYWDLIMLILLITNVIVLPVAIAFFSDEINSPRWIIFNVVSDAFFLFDIVVNFRTGLCRLWRKEERKRDVSMFDFRLKVFSEMIMSMKSFSSLVWSRWITWRRGFWSICLVRCPSITSFCFSTREIIPEDIQSLEQDERSKFFVWSNYFLYFVFFDSLVLSDIFINGKR